MNPLLAFRFRRRRPLHPRKHVPVPTEIGSTSAIFLALRRMRSPLLALVAIFTVAVVGLSAIPGEDGNGNPYRLTLFEAFYVMSYTATTIGFGEIPVTFNTNQRLWVTFMIYASVVGWAYSIGTMLSLLQDEGFTNAWAAQRLGRQIRRIRTPFHIVCGYGETGRSVCRRLDALGLPFVVIDENRNRIDTLEASELTLDIAALTGDVQDPAVLGLAGLGHHDCVGVLALTNDDEANLSVVETVAMLQPQLQLVARVANSEVEEQMRSFGHAAVINPIDRFGNYLVLSLKHPAVYQLVVWLTSPRDGVLPERGHVVDSGIWTVYAEGEFCEEVTKDLVRAGFEVRRAELGDGDPDVEGAVGCVIATMKDATNLAVAARIRSNHPDVLLCVRQVHISARPVLSAFAPHMRFLPTDLVARECLARIIAPRTWAFIEYALEQDDDWAAEVIELIRTRCGDRSPVPSRVTIDDEEAPALLHWLEHDSFPVGDLTRDPQDRERHVPAAVLSLVRGDETIPLPSDDLPLEPGDELLIVSGRNGRALLREVLFNDAQVEYAVSGRRVAQTWIWRRLTRGRRRADR